MPTFRPPSIRGKLTLITALTAVVPLLFASVGFVIYERGALRREAARNLAATAEMFAPGIAPALRAGNSSALAQALAMLRQHDVSAAWVFDQNGRVVASYGRSGVASDAARWPPDETERFAADHLDLRRGVVAEGSTVGSVVLEADLGPMRARLVRDAIAAIVIALIAGFAAYGLGAIMQRDISDSLDELTRLAHRVAADRELRLRARRHGDRDLDRVIDGFNAMLDDVQARDAELRTARDELERRVAERTEQLVREQARFQCIFDAAPVGLSWMVGDRSETRIVNPAHVRITGVPADQCRQLGRYRESTHPDDRNVQDALHAQLVAGAIDHYDIDKRYVHADGIVRWVTLSVRFHRDAATGEMQEINSIVDITDRRQAERAFAEASALLDTMMENTPDLIYFKDVASRFVHYSQAFTTRFRLANPKFLIGKTDFDLFTPEHAQPAFEDEQAIIRSGVPIVGKVEKETYADGTTTWAMTTKMPWRDSEGRIIGTFGLSKDVTELKQAEAVAAYERDLLQILLDSIPDTIYFKDRDSRFVRISRSKVERSLEILRARHAIEHPGTPELPAHLTGITELSPWLIGKTDLDVYGGERFGPLLEEERDIMRTGKPVFQRLERATLPDGRVVWQVVSKMLWRDKNGGVIGTFGTSHDITPIKEAEAKLAATHKQMLELSRQAGMAEVATGVLHNVGNVLNSINVSATLVSDRLRNARALKVEKLAALVTEHQADLGNFMTVDPRGKKIPEYLQTLARSIVDEHVNVQDELEALRKNIDHIKEIVAMQQSYASTAGMIETVALPELVEDALRINAGSLARHDVAIIRDYQARGVITTDKHKVIQILINLVRNAKYACDESGRTDKQIMVRTMSDTQGVKITVIDNGIGIERENLTRIFSHGFTTRLSGHGFGLHSGALAAKELGGSLSVQSDGRGCGATFTLVVPHSMAGASTG